MATFTNGTMLANLIDPEVIGNMIDKKLMDAIKFAPLAKVDTTLQGRAGSTVRLPYYNYIGSAVVVEEGHDIPIKTLSQNTKEVQIYKVANGGAITDEAILSGYGDPVGEFVDQIVKSIADKVDTDLLAELGFNESNVFTTAGDVTPDDIASALVLFGEDIDGAKAVLVSPSTYAKIRKSQDWLPASEVSTQLLISGTVGMIHGCQVILTNRIKDGNAYIVKPEALAIFAKRDTMVETDRDIINKSSVITADKHFATYLMDETKAISIIKNGNTLPYQDTMTYAVNDVVFHDRKFYKCVTAVTAPEAFDATKWVVA